MGLYDSFLTPFVSPALGRIDVSGLENAGRFLEQRAQYDQNRKDRLAAEAREMALRERHQEGLDDYYRMQAETHRMRIQDAKNAAQGKRANALFDAMRKSKTPNERRAVMDELKRLGFSVEELETEVPAVASASSGSAMGQLGTPESDAQEEKGRGFVASAMGVPGIASMNDAISGSASPMEAIAAPSTPKRGGRFVVKDPSGVVVSSFDEPLERAKGQAFIRTALGSLGLAATNDREKRAMQSAVEAGASYLDLIPGDPLQAAKIAEDRYKTTLMQENRRTYPQGSGGGAPAGPSKTDLKIEGMDREQTHRIILRVGGQYDMKATANAVEMAKRALRSLDGGTGMQDLDAFKSYLVQMSGKVVTDREMDQFLSSTGKWNKWQQMVNQYVADGRFPEDFKRELRTLMMTFIKNAERHRRELGANAREQAKLEHLGPDAQAVVYGHFTGDYSAAPEGEPLRGGGGGGAPKPSGGGSSLSPGASSYLNSRKPK